MEHQVFLLSGTVIFFRFIWCLICLLCALLQSANRVIFVHLRIVPFVKSMNIGSDFILIYGFSLRSKCIILLLFIVVFIFIIFHILILIPNFMWGVLESICIIYKINISLYMKLIINLIVNIFLNSFSV